MWSNPPPEVSAMRDMLVASATWAALASTAKTSSIHYPSLAAGNSATPDPEPSLLIEPNMDGTKVQAPGIVTPEGTITVILRQKEVNASAIEKTARAIAYDVMLQSTGLPLVGHKVGLCSMPDAKARAAQNSADAQSSAAVIATRTIPIVFTYQIG